jgi:STAG domain
MHHATCWVCWACSATVRPFRLVAATAVMQLVTSMIRVMSTLEDAQNTAQRQLEAEQKRKGNKVSAVQATASRVVALEFFGAGSQGGVHMACGTLGCLTLLDMCRQAAAERATSLRRTRDQANHRLEELKGHIKVRPVHNAHSHAYLSDCAWACALQSADDLCSIRSGR